MSPRATCATVPETDPTIRLWDLDAAWVTDRLYHIMLCHSIGTPRQVEWERLIPDLLYQPTCH